MSIPCDEGRKEEKATRVGGEGGKEERGRRMSIEISHICVCGKSGEREGGRRYMERKKKLRDKRKINL